MLLKMPFLLLIWMVLLGLFHSYIPLPVQSLIYGLSLSIKSLIIFALPVIVFGLLFKTASQLVKTATFVILFTLLALSTSNFISTSLSYFFGKIAYQLDLALSFPETSSSLEPSYVFTVKSLISPSVAMLLGLLSGSAAGLFNPSLAAKTAGFLDKLISYLLKGLLYLIPIFISGCILKMAHDQILGSIVTQYGQIFGLIGAALILYLSTLYIIASRLNQIPFFQALKNMLPAALTGLGSMSSAAALPLTLLGVKKNAQNGALAQSIIPATVNIHLIGDCFAIPIFSFFLLKSFGLPEPGLLNYLIFTGYFVLAKFSVAAVPGGGILVMLPILENYLGFSPTMLSLITALYILFDPIITSANILGNGAFAMILSKPFSKNSISAR